MEQLPHFIRKAQFQASRPGFSRIWIHLSLKILPGKVEPVSKNIFQKVVDKR
jgi:hypothetical protein